MPEPTAHLVLTVPPEIAAAWERLEPEAQAYWSGMIVQGWLQYILQPPQHVTLPTVWTDTAEDLMKMPRHKLARFVRELERKFGLQAGEDTPHA